MIKKILKSTLLALLLVAFISMPVLAAYQALVQIITTTNSYDMLPTLLPMDNTLMVTNNYIDVDGLDVQVEKSGAPTPRMLADDKTLFASALAAASTSNFYYTTDNTPEVFDVLTGYDGNITIYDAGDGATLELGSDFEIEQKGYVDTDAGASKNLVYKDSAFSTYIDGATNITSKIETWSDTETLAPTGVGNETNLPTLFGAATHWQAVLTDDGDTSYVESSNLNAWERDTYQSADSAIGPGSGAIIDNVTVYFTAKRTGANTDARVAIRTHGVTYDGDIEILTDNYVEYSMVYTANPNTAPAAWTWTEVDAMEIGVSGRSNGANARITQVYAIVSYTWSEVSATATGIANDDYTVKTYGVANEPAWATGDVLHFTGANDSNVNAGTIHDNIPKLWISLWFKLDNDLSAGDATAHLAGKFDDGTHYIFLRFRGASGQIRFLLDILGTQFDLYSTTVSWTANTWYHVIASMSNSNGGIQRLVINGTPEDVDSQAAANTPNGGDLCYGDWDDPGAGSGFVGEIQNVIIGTDDLTLRMTGVNTDLVATDTVTQNVSGATGYITAADATSITVACTNAIAFVAGQDVVEDGDAADLLTGTILSTDEEANLCTGIAPGDETNYWYTDEGVGTGVDIVRDYGSAPSHGDVDAACTWETATYTTGKTGRLCDFYIEVDDGVADPNRWGKNLKGSSVALNGNDWLLNQNNVMPWMDYYYHTVAGVLHAWYQPNDIVEATAHDGVEDVGGSDTTITDATMTEAPGYWVDALVTITASAGAADGESRVCTVFAAGGVITVAPAFSANIAIGDTFTIDFGTLIDRSYYGIEFDGVNDYVDCGAGASLDVGTGDFTIECWVRTTDDTAQFQYIVSKRLVNDFYVLRLTFGIPTLYFNTSVVAVTVLGTTNIATTGDWYYIVGVIDRTTDIAEIFVNNISENTGSVATLGDFDNGGIFTIARYQGNNYWLEGSMDEVRLYKRVLSSTDMDYNYNAGAGRYTPYSSISLAGEWHMEEGSGVTTVDTSGNGNTGTLTLGPTWGNGKVPRPAGNAGTNDSRLTWGVNPSDITLLLGSLYSTVVTLPATVEPAQDIIPETPVIALFGMTAPDNMFSPLFDTFAGIINLPPVILWVTVSMLFVVGGTVGFYFLVKNATYAAFVSVFLLAICIVAGTVPWWTTIIAVLIAVYAAIARSRQVA